MEKPAAETLVKRAGVTEYAVQLPRVCRVFAVVYALYRLLPLSGQNIMLLAASYLFYG